MLDFSEYYRTLKTVLHWNRQHSNLMRTTYLIMFEVWGFGCFAKSGYSYTNTQVVPAKILTLHREPQDKVI
jgi:hypothetical protein